MREQKGRDELILLWNKWGENGCLMKKQRNTLISGVPREWVTGWVWWNKPEYLCFSMSVCLSVSICLPLPFFALLNSPRSHSVLFCSRGPFLSVCLSAVFPQFLQFPLYVPPVSLVSFGLFLYPYMATNPPRLSLVQSITYLFVQLLFIYLSLSSLHRPSIAGLVITFAFRTLHIHNALANTSLQDVYYKLIRLIFQKYGLISVIVSRSRTKSRKGSQRASSIRVWFLDSSRSLAPEQGPYFHARLPPQLWLLYYVIWRRIPKSNKIFFSLAPSSSSFLHTRLFLSI